LPDNRHQLHNALTTHARDWRTLPGLPERGIVLERIRRAMTARLSQQPKPSSTPRTRALSLA
jgi:hypothetical protein